MSEIERQLDSVELSIEEAENLIKKSEALQRLEKNKDFKFLFLEGLMEKDAINQVMMLAAPGLKAPGDGPKTAKAGIQARIDMIGELYNYCRYVHVQADGARKALEDHKQTREELLQEQLEE